MLNVLKEVTINISGKEYPVCCDDWNKLKYGYFFSALTYLQIHEEDTLYKVGLYLDYINNDIWEALDEKNNKKIILRKDCKSIKDFIDEVVGIKDMKVPNCIADYFDYNEVWNDMQDGVGEFKNWFVSPVLTDWGFIALIPRQ